MNRDVTVSDKGTGIKTGKSVQPETPRVTEHVTQIAKPQAFPSLPHAPFSSESVTEKPDYTYLSAGSKPRYLTQEETLTREKIAVFPVNPLKTTSPKALEGLRKYLAA